MTGNTVYDEIVIRKLYFVRNQKVLIDQDLALFYSVETQFLRECVDRNIDRFPEDFMFEMTKQEYKLWQQDYLTSILKTIK